MVNFIGKKNDIKLIFDMVDIKRYNTDNEIKKIMQVISQICMFKLSVHFY